MSAGNIRAWIEAGLRSMGAINDKDDITALGFEGVSKIDGVWKYVDKGNLSLGDAVDDNEPLQITWWKINNNKRGIEVIRNEP